MHLCRYKYLVYSHYSVPFKTWVSSGSHMNSEGCPQRKLGQLISL